MDTAARSRVRLPLPCAVFSVPRIGKFSSGVVAWLPRVSTGRRARRCRRDRPCGDLKSKEGHFAVGRIGSVVMFWHDHRLFVSDATVASSLPNDMVRAIGLP
jgi:hypothetical protein